MSKKTVGFPMIHNFSGDKRDFIPELFQFMDQFEDITFYLEEGYGERLGYTREDYLAASSKVRFVPMEEAYGQDITMILKNPDLENLEMLKDGSVFFTMLHYATRPGVVELIRRKGLKTFAMDGIVDDRGERMFVDYFGTAHGGCSKGVEELKKLYPEFYSKDRKPIRAMVMGFGGVGQGAVQSLKMISDTEFVGREGVSGILPMVATRGITQNREAMEKLLPETDIPIDATSRRDASVQIIDNKEVALMPEHSVFVDLSADRYDFSVNPPLIRAIEGTVNGTIDHYVIYSDDPLYDQLPEGIDSGNRRVTVSCNAWPGVDAKRSINYYCHLMKHYVGMILTKEYEDITDKSHNPFERGLYRSTFKYFDENGKNEI